jgi:uncharacterized membrane protein HdeD (DUF308 family)
MKTNVITDEIRTTVSFEERPQRWGWLLALGILMVISGTLGVIAAVAFTIAGVLVFGPCCW